jgi:hypothetical protein
VPFSIGRELVALKNKKQQEAQRTQRDFFMVSLFIGYFLVYNQVSEELKLPLLCVLCVSVVNKKTPW